jgi:hypothetical protein
MRTALLFLLALLISVPVQFQAVRAQSVSPPGVEGQTNSPAPPPPVRVRGTIVAYDGRLLQIKSNAGDTVSAAVPPDTLIVYNEPKKFSDIKVGDFLGVAAIPGSDGTLRAQDVRVFPEALRGMGEGQYPMGDPSANRTMTNATVAQVTQVTTGGTLELSYHGATAPGDANTNCTGHAAAGGNGCVGQTAVSVAPGVPIIAYVSGDVSLLIPGAEVAMQASPGSEGGTPTAVRILVERNGVRPL